MAIEPELEFVPEQEQDLEFAPLSQEEAGNLTKADYLASGGAPEDVISPEREAVLQQETQRQLQAGATPQQASIEAGKAVDAMGAIRRPDGTIAEGYKPTAQALAEGIIEKAAIPAVKEAQRLGIETVSSGTDKATGVGFAIGRNKDGKVVRFEADQNGVVDSFELEPEEPSRLGAIARTVASQVLPATTGAVAAETAAALTPGGIVPKLVTGAIAGVGGFIAGQKGQEAAGKALLGPERMARISEVLQRDVEKYPISTTAASILTPTGGGLVGLAKGVPDDGGCHWHAVQAQRLHQRRRSRLPGRNWCSLLHGRSRTGSGAGWQSGTDRKRRRNRHGAQPGSDLRPDWRAGADTVHRAQRHGRRQSRQRRPHGAGWQWPARRLARQSDQDHARNRR